MAKRKFYVILTKMLRQRWVGVEWGGDVNVHVNLRHMHNLRHGTGVGCGGDVNVHVNLRHMRNLLQPRAGLGRSLGSDERLESKAM